MYSRLTAPPAVNICMLDTLNKYWYNDFILFPILTIDKVY